MKEQKEKMKRLDDGTNTYDSIDNPRDFDQDENQEPTLENTSFYTIEDGCLYHYCGKTRIKVTEHFASHGKALPALIENVILHTANQTA